MTHFEWTRSVNMKKVFRQSNSVYLNIQVNNLYFFNAEKFIDWFLFSLMYSYYTKKKIPIEHR